MITLEQAKALKPGEFVHVEELNADGTPQRYKVTGKVKLWKRSPERVHVPVKRGMKEYAEINENNLDQVSLGYGS